MLDPDFLAAIGHPARLQALILLERAPATAREVAARAGLAEDEAAEHLRQLADAGLIAASDGGGPGDDEAFGAIRWRTHATGWADLAELLRRVAGDEPAPRV